MPIDVIIDRIMEEMKVEQFLAQYIFVGVTTKDNVIFNNVEPKLILINILQPIVKLEDCVWLRDE